MEPEGVPDYKPISAYGIIGDMRTAALVGLDGSIDWCCFPRFDSPSLFAAILDRQRGGRFRIAPTEPYTAEQRYLPGTNVLTTIFHTPGSGVVRVTDFMPALEQGQELSAYHEIHRRIDCPRGQVEVEILFEPRFDYALSRVELVPRRHGVLATDREDEAVALASSPDVWWQVADGSARARVRLGTGDTLWVVLRYDDDEVLPVANYASERKLEATIAFWDRWVSRIRYAGPYRAEVERSALVLKLLFYAPTGAVVAAPTTSLPEEIGGARNWDYRYSWLRDTAFTLYALYLLGYREDGERFLTWIMDVVHGEPSALQVLYGVGGERWIEEHELPHLEGYRGSRPVRIGNAAFNQRQLDIYGEILDCAFLLHKYGGTISNDLWAFLSAVVDHVCQVWTEPDQGIWEVRSGPQHFVYSKALCWVALDRGIKLATRCGLPADLARWEAARAAVLDALLTRGYDERLGAFTQAFGSAQLDASALAMVLRKVLPAGDPRMRSTVDRVARELGVGGLLRRYLPIVDDGLPGAEGVFLLCSFWLVDCYAEMDRVEEARALFERLLAYANDVGLYAEELDPRTGHHLGNFPQGFTHVALINAATNLAKAEARRSSAGR